MVNTRTSGADLETYRDNPERVPPRTNSPTSDQPSSINNYHSPNNTSFALPDNIAMSDTHPSEDKDAIISRLQQQLLRFQIQNNHEDNSFYKRFMKDPSSFINNAVILTRSGSNFEEWKECLNLSLEMVFPPIKNYCDELSNFDSLKPLEETSLRNLIIKTINPDFYRSLVAKDKDARHLFQTISTRCQKSTRSSALEYINEILSLVNVESEKVFERWIVLFANIERFQLSTSQIWGLFMQATIASPSTSLGNVFRLNVHHALNRDLTISSFEDVANTISNEINNMKRLDETTPNTSVMALRTTQRIDPHQQPPQSRGMYRHPNASPLPTNPRIIQQYGSKCSYCQKDGHWYIDCIQYEKDFKEKQMRLRRLPRKFQHLEPPLAVRSVNTEDYEEDPQIITAQHISEINDGQVLIDSGASAHVSGTSHLLYNVLPLKSPIPLILADPKTTIYATGVGELRIPMTEGVLHIPNVYVCDAIPGTLLSLGRLIHQNYKVEFNNTTMHLITPTLMSFATRFNNFCWFLDPVTNVSAISTIPLNNSFTWHCRLGHASDQQVKSFLKRFVPSFDLKSWLPFYCEQCAKSKGALRRPDLGKSVVTYDNVLDLVVSDVAGPFNAADCSLKYFLTMRDHKSTYVFSKSIVARSDVVPTLKQWLEFLKNNKGTYPKFIRTDNAKEYLSSSFTTFCEAKGIKMVPIVAYSPTENGEAERLNRTIGESARTMLHASGLPEKFWSYAYQVATYIHNRLPNKRTGDSTPLELFFDRKPSPTTLYQFGTKAIIQLPAATHSKLAQRAFDGVFISYPLSERGWIFYIPSNRSVVHSAHAVFPDTHLAPLTKSTSHNKMSIDNILNNISLQLGKVPTNEISDQQQWNVDNIVLISDLSLPCNISEAMTSSNSKHWVDAARNKLQQLRDLNVWSAVEPQPHMKVLGAKWVFTTKQDANGNVNKYKACYVVKGFNQRPGQDFVDCYAPTASLLTLRLLLALKIQQNLHMTTFDISGAYLHSPIDKEIYVKAPTELQPKLKGKIMKLHKALYGTKQAARCWWIFFKSIMNDMGLM
ncbi:hypothetical protein O181_017493 [Austropuccinia psidii MF-1]|uniref:Integrase catalytic domain-containing protein n=1 Tax=Austropuccinia psidii MF-1 TaxID=1389203 RepID=A0A9Q3C782_9BASI|nr:hypothetical protein [Austropuccinia psidii MF-1]